MSDREMLELAAKAAGIDVNFDATQWDRFWINGGGGFWNPITDDGDALRLAVKLRMSMFHSLNLVFMADDDGDIEVEESHGRDPLAATRRAIVRTAAEIGRQTP